MTFFDKKNQSKVHISTLKTIHNPKLAKALANLDSTWLYQLAKDLNEKNKKRNKRGLACVYFPTKSTPNGKIAVTYPKPIGKMLYDTIALQAMDESVIWKLLKAASREHKAAPAEPVVKTLSTVNVLVLNLGTPVSLEAWPDDAAGNKAAEACFSKKALSFGAKKEDMESHLEDGYFDTVLFLTHSH